MFILFHRADTIPRKERIIAKTIPHGIEQNFTQMGSMNRILWIRIASHPTNRLAVNELTKSVIEHRLTSQNRIFE
jgi:hypothetical protein